MPAEPVPAMPVSAPTTSPRVVHILFMDMVRYSELTIHHQMAYMTELEALISQTDTFMQASRDGSMLCSPKGDGMALIFLDDLLGPLRCAHEVSLALRSRPHIRLRMGIHSGPVYVTHNINRDPDVHGDGIVMAQRVMSCGDNGNIFVSSAVAHLLESVLPWRLYLHDIGMVPIKGGKAVPLYNMHGRDFGNIVLPRWIAAMRAEVTHTPPSIVHATPPRRRPAGLLALCGLAAVAVVILCSEPVKGKVRDLIPAFRSPVKPVNIASVKRATIKAKPSLHSVPLVKTEARGETASASARPFSKRHPPKPPSKQHTEHNNSTTTDMASADPEEEHVNLPSLSPVEEVNPLHECDISVTIPTEGLVRVSYKDEDCPPPAPTEDTVSAGQVMPIHLRYHGSIVRLKIVYGGNEWEKAIDPQKTFVFTLPDSN